jgi:dTDP-4-dehydrorhamnose reductase
MSISELAFRVADMLHLDSSLIHPVTTEEMNEKVARPRFTGMSIEKARRELGYSPRTLEEGCRDIGRR